MIAATLLACAINVHPMTLEAIIRVESGGERLALHVNRLAGPQPHASSVTEAAELARRYIAAGYTVDIGLMQVNSRHLTELGDTIEDAFDPCRNIAGGAAILTADYVRAVEQYGEGQTALLKAISAYNTGDFSRGFANGYVSRVTNIPNIPMPATQNARAPAPPNPYTATTLAYSREEIHVRIE